MSTINHVLDDAKRYEEYVFQKMVARGYLTWAAIGAIGSWLSFLVNVFGQKIGVNDDYLGVSIGFLWLCIVGFGLVSAFHLKPEEKIRLANTLQSSSKKSRIIGVGWFISFLIGFIIESVLASFNLITEQAIVGVTIALALGNIWNYIVLGKTEKDSLLVGVFIAFMIPVVLFTPSPYSMLVFGLAIGIPYYSIAVYAYQVRIPRLLLA